MHSSFVFTLHIFYSIYVRRFSNEFVVVGQRLERLLMARRQRNNLDRVDWLTWKQFCNDCSVLCTHWFSTIVINLACRLSPACVTFTTLITYRNPSKPSSDPFTVRTGARAYAFATRLFRSRTITFAQISSSICVHLSSTSWMWSWNEVEEMN